MLFLNVVLAGKQFTFMLIAQIAQLGYLFRSLGMQHGPSKRLLETVLGDLVPPFFITKYLLTFDLGPLESEDAAEGESLSEGDGEPGEPGERRWTALPQSLSNMRKDACCNVNRFLQTCL